MNSIGVRRIERGDGVLARVALKPGRAGVGIVSAGYDPPSGKVTLTVDDAQTLTLTAGQHIEEAEKW